jgi:hypothetical protein
MEKEPSLLLMSRFDERARWTPSYPLLPLAAASPLSWLALTRVSRIPLARVSLTRVALAGGFLSALIGSIVWLAALPALARLIALTWIAFTWIALAWIALASSGVALALILIVSHFALPLWFRVERGNC